MSSFASVVRLVWRAGKREELVPANSLRQKESGLARVEWETFEDK